MALTVTAFAAKVETVSQFVSFDTEESTDFYNPGNTVYVKFVMCDVSLDGVDGISAFDFELYYDSDLVEPIVGPSYDGQGDECDFGSLIVSNPGNTWEAFGKLDADNSRYVLGFADWYVENPITAENSFSMSIPFTVKPTARVDDIVFSFENVMAYNADLSKGCSVAVDDVVVRHALQPDSLTSISSDAIPLDIAGYKHDINNVVYFTNTEMTVADYVSVFMDPVSGQDMMKSFAVIIAASNGEVIYSDLTDSDKSEVVIPADSYIIGIHSDNADDISKAGSLLRIGSSIQLYNLNIESTARLTEGTELTRAGFTIANFETEDGADAYIDYEEKTVTVYVQNVTLSALDDMIKGDISVYDDNGYLASDDIVATGDVIDHLDGYAVVILGDVNSDGKVNQFDYLLLKAHIVKGNELSECGYKAACITGENPSMFDYLALKSFYFDKTDFVNINPNKK